MIFFNINSILEPEMFLDSGKILGGGGEKNLFLRRIRESTPLLETSLYSERGFTDGI